MNINANLSTYLALSDSHTGNLTKPHLYIGYSDNSTDYAYSLGSQATSFIKPSAHLTKLETK